MYFHVLKWQNCNILKEANEENTRTERSQSDACKVCTGSNKYVVALCVRDSVEKRSLDSLKGTEPIKCWLYLSPTAHEGVDSSLASLVKQTSKHCSMPRSVNSTK